MKKTYKSLLDGIKRFFEDRGKSRAIIGVSGGIDSTLSLRLVVDALGKDKVYALIMPEKGVSLKQNIRDAIGYCHELGVGHDIVEINTFLIRYKNLPWKQTRIARMNTKARIRMTLLYNYANSNEALVVGTSNKSELMLGYFTKHGDGAADLEVIGRLYKTEVYKLAEFLRLPKSFLEKKPSAELAPGQSDEEELGRSYKEIDRQLKGRKRRDIKQMIRRNLHKRNPPKTI